MKNSSKLRFKINKAIHLQMLEDLQREHPFAYERVGFLFTTSKKLQDNTVIILAKEFIPVDDIHYIEDNNVGAKINSNAIRKAMQRIMENNEGCFHVHLHNHMGVPSPSFTDNKSLPDVVESFANISQNQANGILILSKNSFYASIKLDNEKHFKKPEIISSVGYPFKFRFPIAKKSITKESQDRQSFLGPDSQIIFENIKVGIVGYGGGGSHIGQQLAHLGVENILIFDNDKVEESNLNRLIGAEVNDVKKEVLKTSVANRLIKRISPKSQLSCINSRWQQNPEQLQSCDVVFGCVDSYAERQQLEAECRRYLIPYIDIGMDVYKVEDEPPMMSGQVILSMPGTSCMRCLGFLTEKKLAIEAAKYGNIGGRPQVVWSNGVLASTAVGVFVDLVTGWTGSENKVIYLSYQGNLGMLTDHIRLEYSDKICNHYLSEEIGTPVFKKL